MATKRNNDKKGSQTQSNKKASQDQNSLNTNAIPFQNIEEKAKELDPMIQVDHFDNATNEKDRWFDYIGPEMNQTTYPNNNLMFEQWKEIQNQIHNDNRNNDFPMPNVQNVTLIFIHFNQKLVLMIIL